MKIFRPICCVLLFLMQQQAFAQTSDPREFSNGRLIPDERYCDEPYIVVTKDGNWVCTMTTGPGGESGKGQHVTATISKNQGRTWSKLIDIEPSAESKSSWVVPLIVPSGRIYAFYNYNGDNVSQLNGEKIPIDTLLGWYVYKYSDDSGRTWSKDRYRLPLPEAEVDRMNDWKGKVQLFWGVDKPTVDGKSAFFAFTRMGKYVHGIGEGWLYRSDNILTESDPAKIHWDLLPKGGRGIRNEAFGSIQEEHNLVTLSNGALYCVYRTKKGYPASSYSRDRGQTWTKPELATYAPGGRRIKSPRACPMVWKTSNGKYLLWFHNTTLQLRSRGRWRKDKMLPVTGRDLIWLAGGVEKDGFISWSQPELLCYTPDGRGASYPDLIEDKEQYFITATNKKDARVIEVDKALLEGMWNQAQNKSVAKQGIVLEHRNEQKPVKLAMPSLPDLSKGGGFTIDFWVKFDTLKPGQVLLDSRNSKDKGIFLTTNEKKELRFSINDGKNSIEWQSDPGSLSKGKWHHVAIIVDGGPKMITGVIDGLLCDGGSDIKRYSGQSRFLNQSFDQPIANVTGSETLEIAPSLDGKMSELRIYNRYLRTSEVIGNYQNRHKRFGSVPSP